MAPDECHCETKQQPSYAYPITHSHHGGASKEIMNLNCLLLHIYIYKLVQKKNSHPIYRFTIVALQ